MTPDDDELARLAELYRRWRAITDRGESRQFLLEHSELLATPRAASIAMRAGDSLGHGVLGLAHEGELELAYAILEDPEKGPPALVEARRTGRSVRLIALAELVGQTDPALGYFHLAIGMAVGGEVDAAVDLVKRIPQPPPDAMAAIGDTIEHRPDHAVGLARLIGALGGADA